MTPAKLTPEQLAEIREGLRRGDGATYEQTEAMSNHIAALESEAARLRSTIESQLNGLESAQNVLELVAAQRDEAQAREALLRNRMGDIQERCEWYGPNGTEQERHHFVAVEIVHDCAEALAASPGPLVSAVEQVIAAFKIWDGPSPHRVVELRTALAELERAMNGR